METENQNDLISAAQDYFNKGKNAQCESILNQLILNNNKEPVIFQMLGTIYYDQGKFNKAIRSFKRALEIDPGYTDASVGLSIILNDLGRYEEGKQVFNDAQKMLAKNSSNSDPYINEKLSTKHDELGELYFQHHRYNEALEQFFKSLQLSSRRAEITMKIVQCYLELGSKNKAIRELTSLLEAYPQFTSARMKLGEIHYNNSNSHLAREQWENVLKFEPDNSNARKFIRALNEGEGQIEL